MNSKTTRYTAAIPVAYVDELKELVKEMAVPSVNFAINEALAEYLTSKKAARYVNLMREAGEDKAFLSRTLLCDEDFQAVDGEVSGNTHGEVSRN